MRPDLISEADTRLRTTLRGRRMVTRYSESLSGNIKWDYKVF
jgi:hypothetical protein